MSIAVQDVLVTVMALLAALTIVRRVLGVFSPGKSSPACDHCASGAAACAKPSVEAPPQDKPVPLVLHRSSRQ
jgi:hypothetical protein